jgi:uncharacterized OsmC-like protein
MATDARTQNGEHAVFDEAPVTAAAGSYLTEEEEGVRLRHVWTSSSVDVRTDFTGAHLLHLAVAGCVLNDTYREAAALNIEIAGVRVSASGRSDTRTWQSTGIQYLLEIDSPASSRDIEQLRLPGRRSRRFPERFDWAVRWPDAVVTQGLTRGYELWARYPAVRSPSSPVHQWQLRLSAIRES